MKSTTAKSIPVVMAGVVPPPVHGQSLATEALFAADLSPVEKHVVEIRSSKQLDEVGKASFGKVMGLFGIMVQVLTARIRSNAKIFYYTAGAASTVPFVRDLILLGCLRPFFRRTLIHYHSGGLPDYLRASRLRSILARQIYGRDAWAISLSKGTEVPGPEWGAARVIEVPNGLNLPGALPQRSLAAGNEIRLLFIGNLYEDKGVFDLLEAAKHAATECSVPVRLTCVGGWPDEKTRLRFEEEAATRPSSLVIDEPGPRYGEEKWQALADADLFVFPTYYRSENQPLVLIEAMACGLPIIAADWRGVGSLVIDGTTGMLVQPHDIGALARAISQLAEDPSLRAKMAAEARRYYERKFTSDRHLEAMRDVLLAAASPLYGLT